MPPVSAGILRPLLFILTHVAAINVRCTETLFRVAALPHFRCGFLHHLTGREIGVEVALRAVGACRAQLVGSAEVGRHISELFEQVAEWLFL